jgi:hypothetical protein
VNRTPPTVVSTALDRLDAAYWAGVDELASRIREDHVVPFCRRKGWDFCAGMGSWGFYPPKGEPRGSLPFSTDHDRLPKRLVAMLDAETLNRGQSIGSFIARDVRASEGFK